MKLLDPTVVSESHNNHRAAPLRDMSGLAIGLLSNGKQNADTLIRETAKRLQAKHAGRVLEVRYKRNASAPAPTELLTGLAHECDYLITAAGD